VIPARPAAAETGDAEYRRWARKTRPSPCGKGSAGEKPILTYLVPEKAGKWPHAWREKLRLNLPFCKSRGLPAGIAQTFEA